MKASTTLGLSAVGGILIIILLATTLHTPTGQVSRPGFLSERLCPAGFVSVYRSSPPLYPGGPAEQLNVVCVPDHTPIEAEFGYFEHRPVPPFDRFRQDTWTRRYD